MLRPLILLVLFLGGAALAYALLRRSLGALGGPAERRLGGGELRDLARRARRSAPLERALALRATIAESLDGRPDETHLLARVDAAVRHLAARERLRDRIAEALAQDGGDGPLDEAVSALEAREVRRVRLREQARALEREGERTIGELESLHLALLELSANEAVLARGRLGEALEELESAGDSARRLARAEAEVDRFLRPG